jgi:hypothetical protein
MSAPGHARDALADSKQSRIIGVIASKADQHDGALCGRRLRLLVAAWLMGCALPAAAYIDPNAGGWLFQLLFPLLVAVGAAWAGLRMRIKDWWWRLRHRKDRSAPREDSDDA